MGKRLVLGVCVVFSTALLLLGAWELMNYRFWLRAHRLDGFLILLLLLMGIATLALTSQVRSTWASISARDVLLLYARQGGLMLLVFAAISACFVVFGFGLTLFGRRPWLTLVGLLLALPLILSGVDMARGKVGRRPRNLALGYAAYALDSWYILGVQALFLPILFITGPVFLVLLLLTAADGASRLVPALAVTGDPILCRSVGIGPPACIPGLAIFFVLYAALFWIVFRYHDQALDFFANSYGVAKETLATLMSERRRGT